MGAPRGPPVVRQLVHPEGDGAPHLLPLGPNYKLGEKQETPGPCCKLLLLQLLVLLKETMQQQQQQNFP